MIGRYGLGKMLKVSCFGGMMIPDLIKLTDAPHYIFTQTGQYVKLYSVRRWAEIGEIPLVNPQDRDRRFRWTTKQAVNEFIRRHSSESV